MEGLIDGRIDRAMNGPMDGYTLLKMYEDAYENNCNNT